MVPAQDEVDAMTQARLRSVLAGLMTAVFVAFAGSTRVLACPVCFGAEETTMISGTKLGVLFMLGITLAVQGAFVGFFVYLRKRAKRMAELELDSEWAELQRASRT
jgi:heme/copper-type cytochrome/quinol oxidase subunit 2